MTNETKLKAEAIAAKTYRETKDVEYTSTIIYDECDITNFEAELIARAISLEVNKYFSEARGFASAKLNYLKMGADEIGQELSGEYPELSDNEIDEIIEYCASNAVENPF